MSEIHSDSYPELVGKGLVDKTLEAVDLTSTSTFTIPHITRNLLARMQDSKINYKHLVGGAIYIAAFTTGSRRTQSEIAESLGCSATSIRKAQTAILEAVPIFYEAFGRIEGRSSERDLFAYWLWFEENIKQEYGMKS